MKKVLIFGILVLFSLSGCVTGDLISQLRPGMSETQVKQLLGNPDGYQRQGNYEAFKYANRLMSGSSWDRTDYYVILKDGKVMEYDHGAVRSGAATSQALSQTLGAAAAAIAPNSFGGRLGAYTSGRQLPAESNDNDSISNSRVVYDNNGNAVGYATPRTDGGYNVYDNSGNYTGYATPRGDGALNVFDSNGNYRGWAR